MTVPDDDIPAPPEVPMVGWQILEVFSDALRVRYSFMGHSVIVTVPVLPVADHMAMKTAIETALPVDKLKPLQPNVSIVLAGREGFTAAPQELIDSIPPPPPPSTEPEPDPGPPTEF